MEGSGTRRKPAAQAPPRKAKGGFGKLVASQAPGVRRKTSRPSAAQVTK
jgi:hypothetical protein